VGTRGRSVPAWVAGPLGALGALWAEWGTLDPLVFWLRGDVESPGTNVTELLLLLSLVAAAAALGAVFARLDATLASLAERNRELEALGEVRTREAVQSERVRIARDLHDVVAHHVSAIVVRAQAVDRVGGDDVEVYRDAVRWIAPEGRNALDAMRSLVRVLREDVAPLAPTSTLADLGAVVERMRGAGLELDARLPQVWPACPAAVGLAVVRVAQEALTNVVSHSAAGRASVSLGQADGVLVLEVTDPGPPRPATTPGRQGNGLVHMRERAVAWGGTLTAGPLAGGTHGWRVRMEVALDGRRAG
jgi:signal transduction histidine kinase